MPGIIRCPESTAIQAGNPDHRGRGEEPGVSACSAGPGVRIPGRRGQRSHSVVVVVPLSVPFARLEPRRWWLRTDACRRVGIRCAGRRPAVMAARRDRGTNASGVARRDARRPGAAARDHGGRRLACGGPAQGRFAGGQLMTEAWSCGGPGQVAGRGGCRRRAEVPGHLGRLCRAAGEAHLTVSGSAVTLAG
jgi:hypothetical protein